MINWSRVITYLTFSGQSLHHQASIAHFLLHIVQLLKKSIMIIFREIFAKSSYHIFDNIFLPLPPPPLSKIIF
jgi:hypothetical protein